MSNLLVLVWLATVFAFILGLINPRWVGMRSRLQSFGVYLAASFISLIALGFVAEQEEGRRGAVTSAGDSAWSAGPGPAGEPPVPEDHLGEIVLRSSTGTVQVSSSRERWDRPRVIADIPSGSDALLLERDSVRGTARCRVRTTFQPQVEGWVMCGNVQ